MHYELTLTALADRDPSCNLFTLTETHRFSMSSPPTPDDIKILAERHKELFRQSWPHNQYVPTLVPIGADIRLVDGTEDRLAP